MKKTFALFILATIIFTGCSPVKASNSSSSVSPDTSSAATDKAQSDKTADGNTAEKVLGEKPSDTSNNIMGKVTAVNKNTITLALAVKPDSATKGDGSSQKKPPEPPVSSNTGNANPEKPDASPDAVSKATGTDKGAPPSNASSEMTFSDETQTISISETTQITSGSKDKTETEPVSSIKVGTIISVSFDTDGETVKSIRIME